MSYSFFADIAALTLFLLCWQQVYIAINKTLHLLMWILCLSYTQLLVCMSKIQMPFQSVFMNPFNLFTQLYKQRFGAALQAVEAFPMSAS